jgi:hypothetical protein
MAVLFVDVSDLLSEGTEACVVVKRGSEEIVLKLRPDGGEFM